MNSIVIPLSKWKMNRAEVFETLLTLSEKQIDDPIIISTYKKIAEDSQPEPQDANLLFFSVEALSEGSVDPLLSLTERNTLVIDGEMADIKQIQQLLSQLKQYFYLYRLQIRQIVIIAKDCDVDAVFELLPQLVYFFPIEKSIGDVNAIFGSMLFRARCLRYLGVNTITVTTYSFLKRIRGLLRRRLTRA